jgi:hypothetical protein
VWKAECIPNFISSPIWGWNSFRSPPLTPIEYWSFQGTEHQVIAGIAGAQPNYWPDRGWTARAILIYLVDRPIDCEEFPFHAEPRSFPPRVIEDGAIIMLRFATDSSDGRVNYASFDNNTSNSSTGSSTSSVSGQLSIVGTGTASRAQGWIQHEVAEGVEGPTITASSTFDVPFCS